MEDVELEFLIPSEVLFEFLSASSVNSLSTNVVIGLKDHRLEDVLLSNSGRRVEEHFVALVNAILEFKPHVCSLRREEDIEALVCAVKMVEIEIQDFLGVFLRIVKSHKLLKVVSSFVSSRQLS